MTTRLLATIEGVFCAVPLRDHLSNLITHTQYIADRNIYAAILDRQQWDKLREEYWATGRQCDHGRLVPDIDFVASDGKTFRDFEECQKHEAGIVPKNKACVLLEQFNAVATDQEKQTLAQMAATCSPNVPACYQYTDSNMNDYVCYVIQKSQDGEAANSPDSYSGTVGSSPTPANTSFKEALAGHKTPEEMGQSKAFAGQMPDLPPTMQDGTPLAPATISDTARLDTLEKIEAEQVSVAAQIDHLDTVTPPQTLEDRMLVVVGSNTHVAVKFLGSLLKTSEQEIREAVAASQKLSLNRSGKSVCRC